MSVAPPCVWPSEPVRRAVDAWHELLERGHFAETSEAIVRHNHRAGYVNENGDLGCHVLRPTFFDRATASRLERAGTLVARAINDLTERILVDPAMRRVVGAPDNMGFAAELDRERGRPPFVSRLDGTIAPDGRISFWETNPSPGGIDEYSEFGQAFRDLPMAREFLKRVPCRVEDPREVALDALLDHAPARGRPGPTCVAVVRMSPLITPGGISRWLAWAGARGLTLLHPLLQELELRGEELWSAGHRIDLVVMPPLQLLLQDGPAALPLVTALRAGTVYATYSLSRGFTSGIKSLFHALSDPTHWTDADPDTRQALAEHIPWTRVLRDERATTKEGREVELLRHVEEHRETLVLKPSYSPGGGGDVHLGWVESAESWRAAIEHGLKADFVVQERLPLTKQTFPFVMANGGSHYAEAVHDACPFVWEGGVAKSIVIRIATTDMTNTSFGASKGSAWIVEDP